MHPELSVDPSSQHSREPNWSHTKRLQKRWNGWSSRDPTWARKRKKFTSFGWSHVLCLNKELVGRVEKLIHELCDSSSIQPSNDIFGKLDTPILGIKGEFFVKEVNCQMILRTLSLSYLRWKFTRNVYVGFLLPHIHSSIASTFFRVIPSHVRFLTQPRWIFVGGLLSWIFWLIRTFLGKGGFR